MIGLCGAHRTGKTTLARAFAEKHGLAFVETQTKQVFKNMGLDPSRQYSFSTRLTIQEEILKCADALYAEVGPKPAITDRTPIDYLMYTMADAVHDSVPADQQERLKQYVKDCIEVTNKRFGVLILVQPGIKLVTEDGKAVINEAYIEHLNSLALGLMVDERVKPHHFYIPRSLLTVEDRILAIDNAHKRAIAKTEVELKLATIH